MRSSSDRYRGAIAPWLLALGIARERQELAGSEPSRLSRPGQLDPRESRSRAALLGLCPGLRCFPRPHPRRFRIQALAGVSPRHAGDSASVCRSLGEQRPGAGLGCVARDGAADQATPVPARVFQLFAGLESDHRAPSRVLPAGEVRRRFSEAR